MSLESHLAELERRHQSLKQAIAEAQAHPGADEVEIVTMKRRKLRLKDEIARLKSQSMH
ncbi:YdcH family protein [Propylenella binzhouense]|uniref:DUF465 domain-containing protein n=1 Tax=Propylenella binzhouense TaxID=2555902 RepID=A0A964WTK7_9HYPH|nr:DUF465 domain-containing protein [Propylenella binzhouense]MYZ48112.1 DUF465 domain-containing protein [Propylenella binzhouense]